MAQKILSSTAGKAAITYGAAHAGGPLGAVAASSLVDFLKKGNPDALRAAGQLFASDEFKDLAINISTKNEANPLLVRRVAISKAFKKYARETGLPDSTIENINWITKGFQAEPETQQKE